MNTKQFCKIVSEDTGESRQVVEDFMKVLFDNITTELLYMGNSSVPGMGKFKVKYVPSRLVGGGLFGGRGIRSMDRHVVKFSPASGFKKEVNE